VRRLEARKLAQLTLVDLRAQYFKQKGRAAPRLIIH
jgi:hypothetical protein